MDWLTIGIIVGIVVVLCLVQFLTGAGDQANKGRFGCMMPKSANLAKGKDLKSERSMEDDKKVE